MKGEVDFLLADKRGRFPQIDTIIFVARDVQITQNNKFSISLQYLSDAVDFLHANKHESFLQTNATILMGVVKHSQSSQNSKFAIF